MLCNRECYKFCNSSLSFVFKDKTYFTSCSMKMYHLELRKSDKSSSKSTESLVSLHSELAWCVCDCYCVRS